MLRSIPLFLILLSFLNCGYSFSQSFSIENFPSESCEEIQKLSEYNTYVVSKDDLQMLHECSGKKYSVFYTFTYWCKPCREFVPDLVGFYYENKPDFNLFFLIPEVVQDSKKQEYSRKSLTNFKEPIFAVSDEYGNRFRRKYSNFLTDFIPDFDVKEVGLGLGKIIVMGPDFEIVYVSTDGSLGKDKIKSLKELIE